MSKPPEAQQESLHRYVRARAPDFSAGEQRDLDAWLAADTSHAEEYARLQQTWRTLDGLAAHFEGDRQSRNQHRRSPLATRRWLLGGFTAATIAFALILAILPAPAPTRHFETALAQHRIVTLPEGIAISLNADTAIDLTEGESPRIDLVRGDIYVDVHASGSKRLEVCVGGASIRDIGTRFAVAATKQGGAVAVEQGQVELRNGTAYLMVFAGHGANFAADGRIREEVLAGNSVASWRHGRWQFKATSLSDLALELARQQRIRVDIADSTVAALTVNGSFGFAEAERVLWAAAQVHGLAVRKLGERHFQLRRG